MMHQGLGDSSEYPGTRQGVEMRAQPPHVAMEAVQQGYGNSTGQQWAVMPICQYGVLVQLHREGSVGTGKKGYLEERGTCRMDTFCRKTEMIGSL